MRLIKEVTKGDKYLTVHYWVHLKEIGVYGWKKKPDLSDKSLFCSMIGELIEL